jgi:hypothetical protein
MSTTPITSPNIEDFLFTDVDFLAADDGGATQSQAAQTGNTPTEPAKTEPQATSTPTANEPFLQGKVSVYNTREDAIKSLDEKDDKIEFLRNFAIDKTGVDPFKNTTVQPRAPQTSQVNNDSYVNNPKKYVEDLAKAWESGDPQAYTRIQNRLIQENLSQVLQPFLPTIQQSVRTSAIEATAKQVKDFSSTFFESPEYKTVMAENKILANAIENAENMIEFKDQLPELYRLAHAMVQNKKVPELLKAAQTVTTQPTTSQISTTQVRPTASPSTMNPPTPVSSTNWKTDPEARKAYIDRMKNGGAESLPLSITRPTF